MVDPDTLLTTLYVMVDDFTKQHAPQWLHPGPSAALTRSEIVTLAIFGQWCKFDSERDFYRWADRHLRSAFPTLPDRTPFNRQMRGERDLITHFALHMARSVRTPDDLYEALDATAVPTRDAKRRGVGWLAGQADIGWSNRLGWFEGFHLLLTVTPVGVITGFGFGAASTKDQPLAETFLAARHAPQPGLSSVGAALHIPSVMDKGFEGKAWHARWWAAYGAQVICPPKRGSKTPWPKPLRRFVAGVRQIIETVNDKLHHRFRLLRERPHELTGFQARLAAKVALHNFCIGFNQQLGRPALAFADLVDW
jgi:hypothetical protein